jgi:GNAT superfamily N-acetyltransferase
VCDSWSAVDLEPNGYSATVRGPWFLRPPGSLAPTVPPDLEIVHVQTPAEAEEFERTSIRGFSDDDELDVAAGSIHPASILADDRMTMLTGRAGGRAVAAAMSYRLDEVVGIYGVTTVPSARRRGYASALTAALVDPALPMSLSPSPMAEGVYRRLGFEHIGELTMWRASTPGRS